MLKSIPVSYEVASMPPMLNYLNTGGLFSGSFRKVFIYDRLGNDGKLNTFAQCEFITKKEYDKQSNKWLENEQLAIFTLFLAKDDKNYFGDDAKNIYPDYRRFNAIGAVLEVKDLMKNAELNKEKVYYDEVEALSLNELLNKPLILGFNSEENESKGKIYTKVILDRVFSQEARSIEELKKDTEALDYKRFSPKNTKVKDKSESDKKANLVKQSYADKYEINDTNVELPF